MDMTSRGAAGGFDGAIDYGKEARAAEQLMQIQLKNANQVMRARQELQKKLFDEAEKEGKAVEDYLAQYGLQKRLDALQTQYAAERALAAGNQDAFDAARIASNKNLAAAEKALNDQRKANADSISKSQRDATAAAAKAEQENYDRRKTAIDAEKNSRTNLLMALRDMEADFDRELRARTYEDELKVEQDLNTLRAKANEQWFSQRKVYAQDETDARIAAYTAANNILLAHGYSVNEIMMDGVQARAEAEAKYQEELAAAEAARDERRKVEAQINYREALKRAEALEEERNRIATKLETMRHEQNRKAQAEAVKDAYGKSSFKLLFGLSEEEKFQLEQQMGQAGLSQEEAQSAMQQGKWDAAMEMLGSLGKQMMATGQKAAGAQSSIDTRLQGSRLNDTLFGSYWRQMDWEISSGIGVSPFVKQETMMNTLKSFVEKGISYNVTQRAFLQTISEKIANTFEAADGTLLKLIRIQQADSTAIRLGMESSLTAFLNSMYETSEYMTEAASAVRQGLYEASALMVATEATELEYQTQKWLGSLYSVGFSKTTELANTFGQLASGQLAGITDGGLGNLLVLSAQRAGLEIGQILQDGIDESDTNRLFGAMVEYLSEIYENTHDSKVLSQEYAKVFGLAASDLKAIANLAPSMEAVYETNQTNADMLAQLKYMSNTMASRASMGEMLNTAFENFSYTMSASLYNNPMLYATYQISELLKSAAGGINIPFINIKGFGLDVNASVADLLKIGALGGSVLGGLGKLVGSLSSAGGFSGSGMLSSFGVDFAGISTLQRGEPSTRMTVSGQTVSESGFAGNENSEDIKKKTIDDASADGNKQIAEAKAEEQDIKLEQVDEHILDIYNLLLDFSTGVKQMNVKLSTAGMPNSWTTAQWLSMP